MVKHPLRVAAILPVVACALAACTSLQVKSDVNTALIGSVRCNTYAWAGAFQGSSPARSSIASPLNESRLRAAIQTHITNGPIQPGPGYADCLIGYGIGAKYVVYGGGPYWGYGWGYGWPGPYVYREGIIGVDLYDARSGQPLWHATVDQDLHGVSGAEAEKRIDAAVAAIFSKYPG